MPADEHESTFWQDHSLHYLEMAFRTDRCEISENPDGYSRHTGACGDTVEMFLTIRNNRIQRSSLNTEGCINTRACANTVSVMIEGKSVQDAWKTTPEEVIRYLETLPPESEHCAELAVGALYLALADHADLLRNPWKKTYRRNRPPR